MKRTDLAYLMGMANGLMLFALVALLISRCAG